MDNKSGEILPGSFLEISIKYNVRDGLSAPDTSTIVEGDNIFIYKVDEKNKVMKTNVTVGDRYLGFVEILDGLNKGDKIVAEGTKKVRPNLTIRPIEKGAKKKQIASMIGNINQMYMYANMLETENHILQSREDEVNNEKIKWAERAKLAEEIMLFPCQLRQPCQRHPVEPAQSSCGTQTLSS